MADPKNKSTTNRRGTRGFGSSSGCWWPQNTGNDFAVRGKDQHKRYNNRQQSYCIDWQLVCKSGSAGQLQNGGGDVTEEVVNLFHMTETQGDLACLPYLHWDFTDPGAHSQLEAHIWGCSAEGHRRPHRSHRPSPPGGSTQWLRG